MPRLSTEVYDYLKELGMCGKTVVDVGSGTGRIAIDLLECGNTVYAVDPDSNMRAISKQKCGGYKNFILVDGTDACMNIPDQCADFVIVSQSYHRFNPELFKKECKRVLKDERNVVILWYRVDYTNPIYAEMLAAVKRNYANYATRYPYTEIEGSRIEAAENNEIASKFFDGESHMENVMSRSFLSLREFVQLGLSLALFPITHEMNSVSEVLSQESFHLEDYVTDLKAIFDKYAKDGKIELDFNVQIHSHLEKTYGSQKVFNYRTSWRSRESNGNI